MGQSVDQIEESIESSRQGLRSNLEELGVRVKSALDWRETFRRHPGATLAVAAVGGVVLAATLTRSRPPSAGQRPAVRRSAFAPARSISEQRALRAWDEIQSALIGALATKVTRTLAEVVPGFKEQLRARFDDPERVVEGEATPKY